MQNIINKKEEKKSKPNFYPKESAGCLMSTKIPEINEEATVRDIEYLLLKESKNFDTIDYVYLIDKNNKLKGVVSIKEIFRSSKERIAQELSPVFKKIITVRSHTDQERVAFLALKHNLKEIPVIDKKEILLGVITSDVILNILHSENIEDVLLLAGAGKIKDPATSLATAGTWFYFYKRFPWLFLGILGGIVAASVISFFEKAIQEQLILAAFIPMIVYMADAVGTQTETILIRSMALEHKLNIKKYIWREIKTTFLLAVSIGALTFLLLFFWTKNNVLGLILGTSIVATILAAVAVAIFLPWLFKKMNYDPAFASGPFATIISDVMSLIIYFGIVKLFF